MADAPSALAEKTVTAEQVTDYLLAHPDFLAGNPELVAALEWPARELGGNVADFQSFALQNLRQDSRALKTRYESLVDFCRDNMSIQGQVHGAVIKLIQTRSLERLLEVITQDLAALFDVDVVRLAMESATAEPYETHYAETTYSGIAFIAPGTVNAALPGGKPVLLIADTVKGAPAGFDQVFADCSGLIRSCALLRLTLENSGRNVLLAFGVRYNDRFHPGQGVELLTFLAQIVAHQLERYFRELVEV